MKTKFTEDAGGFYIEFVCETAEDSARLAKFAMNKKKNPDYCDTYVNRDAIVTYMTFGKKRPGRVSIE